MVWIAGARNLSVAVANWDWKFKNPAHPSFHNPKSVVISVATATVNHILSSVFPVIDSHESIRYQKIGLPKLVIVVKMFF